MLSTKLGTCLDTTILYASCHRGHRPHPLVVAHSWPRLCWRMAGKRHPCPTISMRILPLLSKHVGLNEIVLVETTMMTDGHKTDFDAACTTATTHIDGPSVFECVIDIARCRFCRHPPAAPAHSERESGLSTRRARKNPCTPSLKSQQI